jgi:hypothetical protein
MSEPEPNPPELKAFEAMLGSLVPAAPAMNRDRVMYEAGRASIDAGGRRAWPVATLCVGLVALVVGRLSGPGPAGSPAGPNGTDGRSIAKDVRSAAEPDSGVTHPEPAGDSWLRLRGSMDGDLAADRTGHEARAPSRRPPAATWLEQRRLLLEYVN